MNRSLKFNLLLGAGVLVSISTIAIAAVQANNPMNPNPGAPQATNPLCFGEMPSGQSLDLSKICGQKPMMMPALDPNMPINVKVELRDKPSEQWNKIPDLKTPVQEGKTKSVPAPAQPSPIEGTEAK